MKTILSRAFSYVANMPSAVSGSHGHDATFAVALALVHGFALSRKQARPIIQEFNARCDPPWTEKELDHKLDSAAKVTRHSRPRGYLLGERDSMSSGVEPSVTILRVDTGEPLPGEKQQLSPKENSERSVSSVSEQLSAEDLAEAARIAGELLKLRDAGAMSGLDDPEARFFASVIHVFGGEFIGRQPASSVEDTEPL